MTSGNMQLEKFLDGSIADTVCMQDKTFKVVPFDLNIFVDKGFYKILSGDRDCYTTSSAAIRTVSRFNKDSYCIRKDLETESGFQYEYSPKYEQNLINNIKSRFVHYIPTELKEGNRQTFRYAYMSAIKAVKEVLCSQYFVTTYGDLFNGAASTQVRTLESIYIPTDEVIDMCLRGEVEDDFNVVMLCIISLYYLQKTFTLDRLEISAYDINCKRFMVGLNNGQNSLLTDRQKDIYLTFLYLISTGQSLELDMAGDWKLEHSSQKVFYYDINYRPITYQTRPIDGEQIQLSSVIQQIEEDICILLGYHDIIVKPYEVIKSSDELYNIVTYFIWPNIINTETYKNCVKDLIRNIYNCTEVRQLRTLRNVAKDIEYAPKESLTSVLAKQLVKQLFSTYPEKYERYVNRCIGELNTPRMSISSTAFLGNSLQNMLVTQQEGLEDQVRSTQCGDHTLQHVENDFIKFGYTLIEKDTQELLKKSGANFDTLNELGTTYKNTIYALSYSPVCIGIIRRPSIIPQDLRKDAVNNRNIISYYEFLVDIINNLVLAVENIPMDSNVISLDSNLFKPLLAEYMQQYKDPTDVNSIREYMCAKTLLEELNKSNKLISVNRTITHTNVTLEIKANLFLMQNLFTTISSMVKELYGVSKESTYYQGLLDNNLTRIGFKSVVEAARQLMAFYATFLRDYDLYMPMDEFLTDIYKEELEGELYQFNFDEEVIVDTKDLRDQLDVLAHSQPEAVDGFKMLESYLQNNKDLLKISDCRITAHPEHKAIAYSEGNGKNKNVSYDIFALWEPHTMEIKFSIPYPEYVRIKESENSISGMLIDNSPQTRSRVVSWTGGN